MLPSIAASSSGHWNQDGSRRWQRSIGAVGAEAHQHQHVAAEGLDQAEAFAHLVRLAELGARIGPRGRRSRI